MLAVFAAVTTTGTLVLYNRFVPARAIAKIAAHSSMASAVDWHPTRPNTLATGGAGDRSVKVWTIDFDNMEEADRNSATWSSKGEKSVGTIDSSGGETQARCVFGV